LKKKKKKKTQKKEIEMNFVVCWCTGFGVPTMRDEVQKGRGTEHTPHKPYFVCVVSERGREGRDGDFVGRGDGGFRYRWLGSDPSGKVESQSEEK
jgi:hypothetical protein